MLAIILQSCWAIVLLLFWGTFESLISYVVFTDWIFFALAAFSIFLFRRRQPHAERPYRTLGYPITPAFFVTISSLFVVYTFFEKPAEAIAGLIFLALGIPVYFLWKLKSKVRTS
jgi:APA family basic amino acid/polyamine antiporter